MEKSNGQNLYEIIAEEFLKHAIRFERWQAKKDKIQALYETAAVRFMGTIPCNHVDVDKGRCTLKIGHPGEHVWKDSNA